jgi:hypothetical protein
MRPAPTPCFQIPETRWSPSKILRASACCILSCLWRHSFGISGPIFSYVYAWQRSDLMFGSWERQRLEHLVIPPLYVAFRMTKPYISTDLVHSMVLMASCAALVRIAWWIGRWPNYLGCFDVIGSRDDYTWLPTSSFLVFSIFIPRSSLCAKLINMTIFLADVGLLVSQIGSMECSVVQ